MSLRKRTLVLVLLSTLLAPAAGWTAGVDINPDGQPLLDLQVDTGEDPITGGTEVLATSSTAVQRTATPDGSLGLGSLFDRFLVWLQLLVQPL